MHIPIVEELWTSVKPRDSNRSMNVHFFFRRHIAIGQKRALDSEAYGRGFNYTIEVGFPWKKDLSNEQRKLNNILNGIDHRLLGLDLQVVEDHSTHQICAWIFEQLKDWTPVSVRMIRGDGFQAVSYKPSQP